MRPFSLKIQLIAGLVLVTFFATHLDTAYAQIPAKASPQFQAERVSVPEKWGRVEELSRPACGPASSESCGSKTVIYIQDAHDSLEAQKNIAKLVRHFVKRHGVKTVFEEGFEGPVPTETFFGFMKDAAAKEKVSYFLLDKLRIGGAEYAHINRKEDFQLIGADDRKLHRENIEWYRKNAQVREAAAKDLGVLQKEISSLADRAFPKGLREWKKLRKRLDDGQISFPDYLKRFLAMNQEIPGFSLSVYPNLERLLKVQGTDVLDTKALFLEIETLEKAFAESFLANKEDKTLFEYDRALSLLTRLNEIRLTPSEFEAAQSHLAEIDTRKIADFVVERTNRSLVLSKQWETHLKYASAFYETAHRRDEAVVKMITSVERRADSGQEKNPAGLNTKRHTLSASILVFGGFHERGIKEKLLKNGYSVLTVFPKITEQDPQHQASYKQLMADGHYPFEASFQMARAASPEHGYSWNGAAPEIRVLYETAKAFPELSAPLLARKIETALQDPASYLYSARAEMRPEVEAALKTVWAEAARTTKEILSLMIEGREDLHQKEQLFMVFGNYPDLQKKFPQFFRLYASLPSVLAAAKNFLDQYPNSFYLNFRWDHVNGRMRQLKVGALSQDLVRYGADPVARAREILERLQETEARLRLILLYNQLTAPVFRPAGGPEQFSRQIKDALRQSPEFREWMKIRERIRKEGVPAYAGLPVPVPESERDAYEQRVSEAVRGEELFSVTLPHFIPEDKFHQAYSIGSFEEDREAEAWAKTLQNQKLLDIGASFGGLVKYLRKHGVDAWGIDADRDSVNKAALAGVKPYIRFGDVRFLPYENDSFDAVHSRAVLSSRGVMRPLMRYGDDVAAGAVRSPEDLIAAFLEIKRVLKPGGKAYLENIFNPEEILMLASVTGMSLVRSRIAGEYYTVFMKVNPRHENRGDDNDEAVSFGETSADSTVTETAIAKILEEQKHPFRQVPMELFRAAVMAGIFLSFAWFVYRPWVQPWVEKSPLHLILGMNVLSVFKSVIVGWLGLRFARFVGSAKSKSHEVRAWIGQILYGALLSVPIFGFFVTSWFMGKLPVPDALPEKIIQALVHQGIIAPLLYDPLHYITAKMVIERKTYEEVTNSKMAGNILNYTGLAFLFWFPANWIALLIPDLSWRFIFTNTAGFAWGVAFFVMLRAENLGFLRSLGIARGKTFEEAPQPWNPFYWLYRYYQQPWFGIAMLSGTYWLYIASFTRQIYLFESSWSLWVPVLASVPWLTALFRSRNLVIKPAPVPPPASKKDTTPSSAPDTSSTGPGSRNEARELDLKHKKIMMVWGMENGVRDRKLFEATNSPTDRGASFAERYPHLEVETNLDRIGSLSLFGMNGVANFKEHGYEKISVFLTWAPAVKSYVITGVTLNGFSQLFHRVYNSRGELIGSYLNYLYPQRAKPWAAQYPEIQVKVTVGNTGTIQTLGHKVIRIPEKHAGQHVDVFLEWSEPAGRYLPVRVYVRDNIIKKTAKRTYYAYTLLKEKGTLRSTIYGGKHLWRLLFKSVDFEGVDEVWVPWPKTGTVYLEPTTRRLYGIPEVQKGVYGIYDWNRGNPQLKYAMVDGTAVTLSELQGHKAEYPKTQTDVLETLRLKIEEQAWSEDAKQEAFLAALELMTMGENDPQALWERAEYIQFRYYSDEQRKRKRNLSLDAFKDESGAEADIERTMTFTRAENRAAFIRDDQGQLILNPAQPEIFEAEKMLALWRRLDKDGLRYTGETGSVTPSAIHAQPWTMNDFREEDFTAPLKDLETLRAKPLKLLFPNRIRLSPVHGMNNNGIYINYAEGIDHPILVKTFKEDVTQIRSWQPLEIFAAQLNDFAGTGPRFYGVIAGDPRNPRKITGYAMQAGAGRFAKIGGEFEESVELLAKHLEAGAAEIYRARMAEMKHRLLHFGLSFDGLNYLVRPDGTVTSLDAGDLIYDFLNEQGLHRREIPEQELFEIMRKKSEAASGVRAEERSSQGRAAGEVIFVNGSESFKNVKARVEEFVVLAAADPKRQIVVYRDGAGMLAELLKSFRLKNIKFVKGGFAAALAPYQHRTSVPLVLYGDDEAENTEAWTKERLTRFAGEPGALDYGLKHLDAVRLKKKVEEIQWVVNERGVGYYVVSHEASSASRLFQQAQYVTVFARAA